MRRQQLRLRVQQQLRADAHLTPQQVAFRNRLLAPLSAEQRERIQHALSGGSDDELICSRFKKKIHRYDIHTLRPRSWLNDMVINFYFDLLDERCKTTSALRQQREQQQQQSSSSSSASPPAPAPAPAPPAQEYLILNSFFYETLNLKGFARVKRWTRSVDIFSLHKVIFPVHLGNHWCLACINVAARRFEYYDSFLSPNHHCMRLMRQYLLDEWRDKAARYPRPTAELDLAEWTDYSPSDPALLPPQSNGYDCGLFMCTYANCVAADMPFLFSQENMVLLRQRMILAIVD
eukprot:CAMPEP_0174248146 /NCGR_PEP_ID=MMETSP0417-20130205/42930_1 /TAXON_ID=242541 /ORGANISM="Mayorella sp, Strain BSH-02190019" /LENGTH=290 /DNA_ID=CAMNT_0015328007 /DNA_START=258 /DNA_END=1127 /DNA_ORIENTATION=+